MLDTTHIKPACLDIRKLVEGDARQEILFASYLMSELSLSPDAYSEGLAFINTRLQIEPNHAQTLVASALLRLRSRTKEENSTGINHLDKAFAQGSLFANVIKGLCLCLGLRTARDPAEGVRLFRIAGDKGYSLATNYLATCYQIGMGVTKNLAEAVRLLRIASDAGNGKATNDLALCYLRGRGITNDPAEALRLLNIAHNAGYCIATSNLANCYLNGTGIAVDWSEAVRLLQIASDAGDSGAIYTLAYCYKSMGLGLLDNLTDVIKLYIKAIDYNKEIEGFTFRFKELVDSLETLQYQHINPGVLAKWCARMCKIIPDNNNSHGYFKQILRNLMKIYTDNDAVQYHATMTLYNSSWGLWWPFKDYIRKLINQDPNKFTTFLIQDNVLSREEKKKYYMYIQAKFSNVLSSGVHAYVVLYELSLLPTLKNRNSFFFLLPTNVLEETAKIITLSSIPSKADEDIELALTRPLGPRRNTKRG